MGDDIAVSGELQETPTTSAVEEKTPEVETVGVQQDDGEIVVKDAEPEEPKEEPVEETQEEPEPTEAQDETEELAPKSQNRFQKLANENRELKEQIERLRLQETQLATEGELLNEINPDTGDYYTPQEIERIAFQQTREQQMQQVAQERYQLEVQQNQASIANEATQALQEFPMFDSNSPEFNPELTAQADALLKQSLIVDENGVLLGSHVSPYQLYKTINDSTQANAAKMQAEAQRANEKMLANVDPSSSGQRSEASFEKLSLSEMQQRLREKGHDI